VTGVADTHRAQIFGEAADTYDAARPEYPAAVIDLIVLDAPGSAVDVGCGTGKAARKVMARGVAVLGVEPDPRMAAVARSHGVDVVDATFEDWPPSPHDCVFSGQAWHWVDPVCGARKAAAVLPPGGRWAAFWNREHDPRLTEVLVGAYNRWAPQLIDERQAAASNEVALVAGSARGLASTRAFERMERYRVNWTEELGVARLVDRVSTNSGHRLLPTEVASRIHDRVTDELGGADAIVQLDYTTLVLTARRR
jgi:SAM-dependent methyltransferase